MLSKKKIIGAIVLLVIIAGGYYYFTHRDTGEKVPTEVVKRGDIAETVSVTGELKPTDYADLSFKSVGIVDAVLVKEGDSVSKGGRIASVDRSVLYSQLQDARLAVSVAEQVELAARRNKSGLNVKADVQAKKYLSEQARQKMRTIAVQMEENVLYAPFDGEVSRVDMRAGETVTLGKIVARVFKPGEYVLEARVPESDIAKVTLGMKARVTFDALNIDDVFEADVTEIERSATVVQDVVSYAVKFRLGTVDARLKDGMTGNIDIETAKRTGVLWVPFRALVKEGTKSYAQIKRADATFEKVEVTTGLEGDDGTVEVKSGLKEGDEVAIGAVQKK